ncbi:17184_t:CDS:1 [Acaulospora morrowiae]|uniref:17184_t:CDS:1 n=1 Tax=Acaulospora morrowiae TaxID=94023 RepID=A0A9N9G6L8_9GLOM|nr:17184_t:CDS:1 [Acaulospora morrowiae]
MKSKRGRKTYSVTEGYIDPTGQTHVMIVRRSLSSQKKKTNKCANKNKSNCCKKCENELDFVDALAERINGLESLVRRVADVTKKNCTPITTKLSQMETDDLLFFSNNLETMLSRTQESQVFLRHPQATNQEWTFNAQAKRDEEISEQYISNTTFF